MTFDEMAAQRDPLYAATKPVGAFRVAVEFEEMALESNDRTLGALLFVGALYDIAIRALRNQGEPYYTEAK